MSGKMLKKIGVKKIIFNTSEQREEFEEKQLNDLGIIEYTFEENIENGEMEYIIELI